MKIVFMGTPDFAVPALKALHQHHQIIAVYTQAPKPAGRGQKETLSAVHQEALALNIPVFTPKTLRNAEAQQEFLDLKADCAVVAAYGLILPQAILDAYPLGCINIHPSMLPKFRGAAPMQRTILAGEKETAMCIMQMDAGVDTGDILMMLNFPLDEEITYPQLSSNMAALGAAMLIKVLEDLDNITPQKQSEEGLCYANKITKEEGELDFNLSSQELMLKVRALNPWPGTFFWHNNEKIKVLAAKFDDEEHNLQPGEIKDSKELIIACSKGFFYPLILQRPGKNPTKVMDFMRGYKW